MQVGRAIATGIKNSRPHFACTVHPMADGGDGSAETLAAILNLQQHNVTTVDPLGNPLQGHYYTSDKEAFIELATASGIVLLTEEKLNPMNTSTYGTGLLIAHAIESGYKKINLFLGGSATNDAGTGIAQVLGFQFLDKDKNVLTPCGKNLEHVHSIRNTRKYSLGDINLSLMCDVQNTAFGPNGAAYVFAKQKGATPSQIKQLDRGVKQFCEVIRKHTGNDVSTTQGGGAAGAVAAGLKGLLNAYITSGIDTIAKLTRIEDKVKSADVVISGEGAIDNQSIQGKVVSGIANICGKYDKPLIVFVGKNELSDDDQKAIGIEDILEVSEKALSIDDAMQNAETYLIALAQEFAASL